MQHFTPFGSTLGGILIGLASSALLLFNGRIAGISGVLGQALTPGGEAKSWRWLFLLGLLSGGVVLALLRADAFDQGSGASTAGLVVAGLLVGFGTRLGSGCTSGHGVCGIARRSLRSITATGVFMATSAATVFLTHHLLGGAP